MHALKSNFDKFYQITLSGHLRDSENIAFYPRKPKMDDCQVIALALTAEALGIDSENYLWCKLQSDYSEHFPALPDCSNYNRRKRRLCSYIHLVAKNMADQLPQMGDCFLVDSMPVPVCKIARERRCKICRESFETAPDKGYTASLEKWFFGYKLQLVTSINGVFRAIPLS